MSTMPASAETTNRRRDDRDRMARAGDRDLRQFLERRRWQTQQALDARVNDIRARRAAGVTREVVDLIETSELAGQEDLDYALVELERETLRRIDEALHRLEVGAYGTCVDCGQRIAASRLRALPFVVRCRSCEEMREAQHVRQIAWTRLPMPIVAAMGGRAPADVRRREHGDTCAKRDRGRIKTQRS